MLKERTPEQVYEDLAAQGMYEEANLDRDELEKIIKITIEDYEFGESLEKIDKANWRIIFNIHYDILRELCNLLMVFKKQKISSHQGLFAFIILNFPELNLDWKFFETVRKMRNQNKYMGTDVTRDMWRKIKFQINLYISTMKKEIEKKLKTL